MDTNAKITPVAAANAVNTTPAPPPALTVPPAKAANDAQAASYRLVIEEGPSKGTFVYKTVDGTTGEVVRQFPREQVLRLAEARNYDAGAVIDTNA